MRVLDLDFYDTYIEAELIDLHSGRIFFSLFTRTILFQITDIFCFHLRHYLNHGINKIGILNVYILVRSCFEN
jgi:hypothetical protein